jgi:hypothetical protein
MKEHRRSIQPLFHVHALHLEARMLVEAQSHRVMREDVQVQRPQTFLSSHFLHCLHCSLPQSLAPVLLSQEDIVDEAYRGVGAFDLQQERPDLRSAPSFLDHEKEDARSYQSFREQAEVSFLRPRPGLLLGPIARLDVLHRIALDDGSQVSLELVLIHWDERYLLHEIRYGLGLR